MRRADRLLILVPVLAAAIARGQANTSALVSQALDRPLLSLTVQGGLDDVLRTIEAQTGVHVTPSPAVLADLPWGDQTTLHVNVQNTTLRQTLDAISQHLGLVVSFRAERVELEPIPALARLGRRATVEEISLLDFLSNTSLPTLKPPVTVAQLLGEVKTTLEQHDPSDTVLEQVPATLPASQAPSQAKAHVDTGPLSPTQVLRLTGNLTLLQALDQLDFQTSATWIVDGTQIVIVDKKQATLQRLQRRLTRRFQDVPLQQVLLELSEAADLTFAYTPGLLQQVPAPYQRVTLILDDATIEQTLQSIGSVTGLSFEAQPQQVWFTFKGAPSPATPPPPPPPPPVTPAPPAAEKPTTHPSH